MSINSQRGEAGLTPLPDLTPAEHRKVAESLLRQLQSHSPGSMVYHGLASAAKAHVLAAVAAYLEPDPEPDIPGLPVGWRITTRQKDTGSRFWGYVLTRPGHDADCSAYKWGSSGTALLAGLQYAGTLQDNTEDNQTGEQS